jgi:hypothetical protein
MTGVYAPELYPRKRPRMYSAERDRLLRENPGVDTAILAEQMHVTERFIISYQRKLGIRQFTGNGRNKCG